MHADHAHQLDDIDLHAFDGRLDLPPVYLSGFRRICMGDRHGLAPVHAGLLHPLDHRIHRL